MFSALEIGHPCDLPDGKYTKGQVHAIGSRYTELQQFAPKHKPNFRSVVVEGGLVVGTEWADVKTEPAPQPAPVAQALAEKAPDAPKLPKKIVFGKK
jgi:hypothetical protein